jgi:hypothetical protein
LPARRSYKTDESFLEKISIGAAGTQRVYENLRQQGHTPIELERGSMSFKIWKAIKIKRIRVPDILCTACGLRVEARAKTKLELSMSHSLSDPERGWDFGLEDSDFVAYVVCRRIGERPIDWQADNLVQYVSVKDMRVAHQHELAQTIRAKGAQEGFEARIEWIACIARAAGTVTSVSPSKIQYCRALDNRKITLSLKKKKHELPILVSEGSVIAENQVLAAVVPVSQSFLCPKTASEQDYIGRLASSSLSDRYGAAKSLSYFMSSETTEALAQKVADSKDHIYVRLEASASLSRRSDQRGVEFIAGCLQDTYLENRLEAVIILGEVGTPTATKLLIETLTNSDQHPEIRAGAAWALGEIRDKSALDALIASFVAVDEEIRIEAARALAKLSRVYSEVVITQLPTSTPEKRAGIAWAAGKSQQFTIQQLLHSLVDDNARRWVAYIIGTQDQENYINQVEALKTEDPQVYFAVTVLWQIMSSWVYGLEEYG